MALRYWVGGTAAWDAAAGTKWSTISGGGGGAAIPTTADDVFFDAASGANTVTISVGNAGAKSITCTGFTGTLAGTATITVAGNITLVAGMGFTYIGGVTVTATATLTSSGKSYGNLILNRTGGTFTLADALNVTARTTSTLTLSAGALTLNGFTATVAGFTSTTTTARSVAFGTANIALTSTVAGTTVLNMATTTGFTWTGTGGFTRNQAVTATISISSATLAAVPNISVNAGASTLTISNFSGIANLNFTGSTCAVVCSAAFIYGNLTLATGGTYTSFSPVFGLTSTVTSVGRTLQAATVSGAGITVTMADALTVASNSTFTLTQGTINLNGFTLTAGSFSSANTNTRSIAFGAGTIVLSSTLAATTVLNMGTATNFTWTGAGGFVRNQAATATVSFGATGGSAANAPNLTVNAGAAALTVTSGSYFKAVNFTGSTCTVTATYYASGFQIFAVGGTYTAVNITFINTQSLTTNGRTLGNITVSASGAVATLNDALTCSAISLVQGTLTTNNQTVTAVSFASTASGNTRVLNLGSSAVTITGGTTTAWNISGPTGLTINAGTSTISLTGTTQTFVGGGYTYYNLNFGAASTFIITGANTFNNLTDSTQPLTVTFPASTVTTVSNFSLSGTAGNLVTINSSTPGTQFTLTKVSGTVSVSYVSIQDSNANGGAIWNSLLTNGCVDAGNNLGWIFATAVTVAITGVLATGAVGTLGVAHTNAVTGVLATGAVGTVALGARSRAVTGVLATGDDGTLGVAHTNAVTGVLATGAVGTVGFGKAFPITSVLATGAVGTLGKTHTNAVTGVLATGAVGTVGTTRTNSVTGVLATGDAGTLTVTHTNSVTGVLATGAVGTLDLAPRVLTVTGAQAAGYVGNVGFGYGFPIAGVQAAGAVGSVTLAERSLGLSGVQASGLVGQIVRLITQALTGVRATGNVGTVYPGWNPIPTNQDPNWDPVGDSQTPTWVPVPVAQTPTWTTVGNPQGATWTPVGNGQAPTWTGVVGDMTPSWYNIPMTQAPAWVDVGTAQTATWTPAGTNQIPTWTATGTGQAPTWDGVDTEQTPVWVDIIQQ